jgi:flagellar basal-body rod protein FlgB
MDDPIIYVVQTALRGLSMRQQSIGNNLANVDTPGFKGTDVAFETELKRAMGSGSGSASLTLATTNGRHLAGSLGAASQEVSLQEVELPGSQLRNDGNNVDVDREMARLAETSLTYNALVQAMNMKLSGLRSAIFEGRR